MLKQEIEKLVKLQELDSEIQDFRETIDNSPLRKKQMEQSIETAHKDLLLIKKEQKKLQVERKDKELELLSNEEETKKLQKRLDEVKTNKEYSSILTEIENFKKKKSSIEDMLLLLMEKDEQLGKQLENATSESERIKAEIESKMAEETQKTEALKQQLKEKEERRASMATEISKDIFALYEKIRKSKKDGVAICELAGESCTGCSVFVPTYMAEKVKAKKTPVQCENCSRILY